MAFALIDHCKGVQTTSAMNSTGANLVVAVVSGFADPVITDSKSNTIIKLTNYQDGLSTGVTIHYFFGGTVGAGHTFTTASSTTAICAAAFSGSLAAPVDVNVGGNNAVPATTVPTPTATPTLNGELIISGICFGVNTPTIDSGMIILDSIAGVISLNYGSALAYKSQGIKSSIAPTWTFPVSDVTQYTTATFKVASFTSPGATGSNVGSFLGYSAMGSF